MIELNAYCINLDRATGKWEKVSRVFHNLRVPVSRFSAVVGKTPHIGCMESHQAILNLSKHENKPMVLIFEDEVRMYNNWFDIFIKGFSELPEDWDALYLGTSPGTMTKYSPWLLKIESCKTAHAILFNKRCYDILINSKHKSFDCLLNSYLLPRGKSFCLNPMVAWQSNRKEIVKRFNAYVKGL